MQTPDFTKSKMNRFTYADWNLYFKHNDKNRLKIDYSNDSLTAREKEIIFPSICYFQCGEKSDGRHLIKTAERFAETFGKADYMDCIRWFIKEENTHSSYLKSYMAHYAIPEKNSVILDRIFRRLRQTAGLPCEVTVLVTAEIIALSYYDALMNASGSQALKSICRQMLHDEIPHVMFQSHTLSYFRKGFLTDFFRIILMEAVSAAVWFSCRKVFLAGGWTWERFIRTNLCYLKQSIALTKMHPAKKES